MSHPSTWSFLTNHARVLICIAGDPGVRLRELGAATGITERAAHRIVSELVDAGYVTRRRVGRRNHYTVRTDLPVPDAFGRKPRVGELLSVLAGDDGPPPEV
ncbi:MAG TPA: MarR family winged helix-turn-helix transcriptional regulator [Solirubrobacteraceae bacterium]|nr:MarR family winged helix-turn-helix transcriptional regulator [Solirubrobacteraceae bacterium]